LEPTQEIIDQLYRERILRARAMSMEDKFFLGAELFDQACRLMADGIRNQFPEANAAQVQEILEKRLRLLRDLEGGDYACNP
jgi:hypothetical protein